MSPNIQIILTRMRTHCARTLLAIRLHGDKGHWEFDKYLCNFELSKIYRILRQIPQLSL